MCVCGWEGGGGGGYSLTQSHAELRGLVHVQAAAGTMFRS